MQHTAYKLSSQIYIARQPKILLKKMIKKFYDYVWITYENLINEYYIIVPADTRDIKL